MNELDDFVRPLRALADPARLRIVTVLLASPRTVGEAADLADMSLVNASYHLCVLHKAGLVSRRAEGRSMLYWIPPGQAAETSIEFAGCRLRFSPAWLTKAASPKTSAPQPATNGAGSH
jgi:predicted transcriptional regulator